MTAGLICPACLWEGSSSQTRPSEGGKGYGRCPACAMPLRWPNEAAMYEARKAKKSRAAIQRAANVTELSRSLRAMRGEL